MCMNTNTKIFMRTEDTSETAPLAPPAKGRSGRKFAPSIVKNAVKKFRARADETVRKPTP